MDKSFLKKQEEKLKELKKQLEAQLGSFAKKDEHVKDNWKSDFPSFDGSETGGSKLETAQDEVEEYLNRLPIEHTLEIKLRDINLALERIKKNQYGKCEKCGRDIPVKRLRVCPEARFCLKCQNK
jgi:RNA polymerase-binding transcription factor DksA